MNFKMPTLDSYFQSQGKSFDSYQHWLQEATPEELVAGGVRPGLFMRLELGREKFENLDLFFMKHGFNLRHQQETSHLKVYALDEKRLELLITYLPQNITLILSSENPPEKDQEIATGLSQILQNLIQYIHMEKINASLQPDDGKYEIQTANFNNSSL